MSHRRKTLGNPLTLKYFTEEHVSFLGLTFPNPTDWEASPAVYFLTVLKAGNPRPRCRPVLSPEASLIWQMATFALGPHMSFSVLKHPWSLKFPLCANALFL